MSADIDYINLAGPAIVAAMISGLFMIGKKINKTESDVLTGGLKLQQLVEVHTKVLDQVGKLHDRMASVEHKLEMLDYRIFRLERNGTKK